MTSFDERKKAYENKFAHDQEIEFKAKAKRNKMLATWAAGAAGLAESEYVDEIVSFSVNGATDEQVIEKVLNDLIENGVKASKDEIVEKMELLFVEAKESFK